MLSCGRPGNACKAHAHNVRHPRYKKTTPLSVLDTSWAVNLCRTDVTSTFLFSNVSRSSLIEVLSSGDGRARSLPRPRQVVGSEDARRWEPRQRREETPPSQKQSFALGSIYDCHFLALFGKPFPSVVLLPPFFFGSLFFLLLLLPSLLPPSSAGYVYAGFYHKSQPASEASLGICPGE